MCMCYHIHVIINFIYQASKLVDLCRRGEIALWMDEIDSGLNLSARIGQLGSGKPQFVINKNIYIYLDLVPKTLSRNHQIIICESP